MSARTRMNNIEQSVKKLQKSINIELISNQKATVSDIQQATYDTGYYNALEYVLSLILGTEPDYIDVSMPIETKEQSEGIRGTGRTVASGIRKL